MSKNINPLIFWVIAGIVSLVIFILFYNHISPTASIDLKFSKEDALKKSVAFIETEGFDLKDYDKTAVFYSDYNASVYLQKEQGIKKSNQLIRQGIPIWFWRVRWFKELQKKGFIVDIDPSSGEILRFYYLVLDDEKGADLTELQAKDIAQDKITHQGIDLKEYTLKDIATKRQRHRTDYYFEWEKNDYKISDATLRVKVDIYGDRLGIYKKYLKIPEGFSRYLEKEISFGTALSMLSRIVMFLLSILAVFLLITRSKLIKSEWRWKLAFIFACVVVLLEVFTFLNQIPLLWITYPDTISKMVFIMLALEKSLFVAFAAGVMIFAYGTIGELLSRDLWQTKMPLIDAIRNRRIHPSQLAPIFIIGYSLGFIFLGYITLFYFAATKVFNIWMFPDTEYSNILGTAMPFLFSLTIAVSAAVKEEFMYRLFSIAFLKRYTRLTWLAVLLPALIWGFAHSNYPIFPNYVRGIELTIFGIILGMAFLKYGVETVIIAHFVINASLAGLPLLKSNNPYFIISGIIVVSLALLPILTLLIRFKKDRQIPLL